MKTFVGVISFVIAVVIPLLAFCEESNQRCNEDLDEGFGNGKIKRYYYDKSTGICRQFFYRGYGGNDNNFLIKQECIDTCNAVPKCQQPPESGTCEGYFPKYFFNSDNLKCEEFIYGGCDGNDNRFDNIADCEDACFNGRCQMRKDVGRCYAKILKYYHDKDSLSCKNFDWGGCKGNANRFDNINDCRATCGVPPVCEQPARTGPCLALFERYFFNTTTGRCENFTYGGCSANDNNFETKELCEKACKVPRCEQKPDPGPCDGNYTRYYHDTKSLTCRSFSYGGCGGNENRFRNIEDCRAACGVLPTCQQPKRVGPCKAAFPRYYYNSQARQCQPFIYGGCQGNDNNFLTIEECEMTCTPCYLEPDVGNGKASLLRYYYNNHAGRCEWFYYGGIGGNGNNFKTIQDCENTCRVYCPTRNNIYCFREQNFCCSDSDCGCKQICCQENCGKTCYEPTRVKTNGTRVYVEDPDCQLEACLVPED